MKQFYKFRQNVQKIVFAHFYTRVIGIIENYLPEILKIDEPFNEAKEALSEAEDLKIQDQKVPLTKEQKALSDKLDKAISVLLNYVVVKRRKNKETSQEVIAFYDLIEKYLRGYARKNLYQKTGVVIKMLNVIGSDTKLQLIVEAEKLAPVLDKILAVYNELDVVYLSRRKAVSDREKLRTDEIKRDLYFNLRELFTSIEMAKLGNPELSYDALISELNQEIMRFNAGSKPRRKSTTTTEENPENSENTPTGSED